MTDEPFIQVGCSGLPSGLRRSRYFEQLDYLECPETYSQPPALKVLRRWRSETESGRFGILASRVISHRPGNIEFPEISHEDQRDAGGFRDTAAVHRAVEWTAKQLETLAAEVVIFRSATDLSPSAADRLRRFFSSLRERAEFETTTLAWEPSPLWEAIPALRLAAELDLALVVDPLAENPLAGSSPAPIDVLDPARPAYFRITGLGRSRPRLRPPEVEVLAERIAEFSACWVVFAHRDRGRDAKALRAALAGGV